MAEQFDDLSDAHAAWLLSQKIMFTGTAAQDGRVNVSPRPTDVLRVMGRNRIGYLDFVGSGFETAAHVRATGRMTVMACAFEAAPRIMRLYGQGTVHHAEGESFAALLDDHWDGNAPHYARAIVTLDIEMLQTSCGYGVPLFTYDGERDTLPRWAEKRRGAALKQYRRDKNSRSIDGYDTGLILPKNQEA
ncbi:MAG: pyridoxamine 5'-phosphate oxidase family protein [Pseudomonadota bacterium]